MLAERITWNKIPTARTSREKAKRTEIRRQVYKRSGGLCELGTHPNCVLGILPFSGSNIDNHGYLIGRSLTLSACYWACWRCAVCAPAAKPVLPPVPAWIEAYYGN